MIYLYAVVLIALISSFVADKTRTYKAIKIAYKRFSRILPGFVGMLVLVSVILTLVPNKFIVQYLGKSNMLTGTVVASFFGSITLMPGFIAYPLCGILLQKGVSYTVISAFSTTLMMVGFVTFPIEQRYFGTKVTVVRNLLSFLIALVVAVMTGIFFGEIFPWMLR
ncbi:MAG: permease [Deltaproteobacteria bacterium]|nr:permease [Deltaproteobacteria bacterium]MBW1930804.1 permease [Deltaproteobacteria bacterium]MBW2024715.1 permease [Deltaproteobacteria bacterium]MBW2125480.1 permease [Deltaproteobacteria bacterium]RLB19077.1 MAG: hypothetical protein DRG63_01520 [Deltaproteobacteria bacterium]